ncbi:MAG: hypothetical protein LBI28_00835 [Treponema sp.]|jgi:hypothetical protein|nr:hypothetical protein [Treponema sp.]
MSKPNSDKFWLEPLLLQAFQKLYKNDSYLIEHGEEYFLPEENIDKTIGNKSYHVSERGIVFKFGVYLQEIANCDERLRNYDIDIEYNRKGNDQKKVGAENVCPDLIIHKRGHQEDNLLVIEFKPHWNDERSEDIKKLCGFIEPPYKYENALSVLIGISEPKLDWVSNKTKGKEGQKKLKARDGDNE